MTKIGIIGGTGVYEVPGVATQEEVVETRYGKAKVYIGKGENGDIVFLTRHGVGHSIPPHKVNYRANITAMKKLGISRALGIYCVGSLTTMIPPGGMVLLDQFIDMSVHREATFFQGGEFGLGHTDMVQPYCITLRDIVYNIARKRNFDLAPTGTYVSTNGPRFETSAEIRMYAGWGGDVVGMTGGSEVTLAREAGIHFAGVAYSVNYGAGLIDTSMKIENADLDVRLPQLIDILIESLRSPFNQKCICDTAVHFTEKPKLDLFE